MALPLPLQKPPVDPDQVPPGVDPMVPMPPGGDPYDPSGGRGFVPPPLGPMDGGNMKPLPPMLPGDPSGGRGFVPPPPTTSPVGPPLGGGDRPQGMGPTPPMGPIGPMGGFGPVPSNTSGPAPMSGLHAAAPGAPPLGGATKKAPAAPASNLAMSGLRQQQY